MASAPLIGVTSDILITPGARDKAGQALTYLDSVTRAGGVPVLLPPIVELAPEHARRCDAIVFTGGNDISMVPLGGVAHPHSTPMHPQRQAYEFALLQAIDALHASTRLSRPVLGVCLGMQMMAVHRGGSINQHLPDTLPTAGEHRNDRTHRVSATALAAMPAAPAFVWDRGEVTSNHHQGVVDPGRSLAILAHSPDGVIEALADLSRPFYVGVQWHPERTTDAALGQGVFDALIAAACEARPARP